MHLLDVLERDPLSVEQASVDYENLAMDHRAHRQVPEHLAKHAGRASERAGEGGARHRSHHQQRRFRIALAIVVGTKHSELESGRGTCTTAVQYQKGDSPSF